MSVPKWKREESKAEFMYQTYNLSPENIRAERARIRFQRKEYDAGRMPAQSIWQSYQSWRGYAKKCDNYKAIGEMDQYFNKIMKEVDFSDYRRTKRSNGEKPEAHSGAAE